MIFKNVKGSATLAVASVVARVSALHYHGNLKVDGRAVPSNKNGSGCRFTLRAIKQDAKPARLSTSGLRTNAVDDIAEHRVMEELFDLYPNAMLVTGTVTFTDRGDYLRRAKITQYREYGT
jgi:hypothetical protein